MNILATPQNQTSSPDQGSSQSGFTSLSSTASSSSSDFVSFLTKWEASVNCLVRAVNRIADDVCARFPTTAAGAAQAKGLVREKHRLFGISPSGIADIDCDREDGEDSTAKEAELFKKVLMDKRKRWANVTNESILEQISSKELYQAAARQDFPALLQMMEKLEAQGMVTPYTENEGKVFVDIVDSILSRERSRIRTCWLNFLHSVCDQFFNDSEPRETGMMNCLS